MEEHLSQIVICEKCGYKNSKTSVHCVDCGHELRKDYYHRLWWKNLVITLVVFLLPLVILFSIVDREISRHFEDQVRHGLVYSVDVNARTILSFLEERKSDLLSISKLDVLHLERIDHVHSFLQGFIAENPWFDFIAFADPKGDIIYSTNSMTFNVKNRIYFQQALQGDVFNSGIFHSDILDTTAMILAAPLLNRENAVIGVAIASLCLKTFYDLILDLRIGETSEVFLVSDSGIFLSPSRLGGSVLEETGHHGAEPNPHTGTEGVLIHRDYRGEKVICAYRRFKEFHGYLVSEMDVDEALAPVTRLKHVMFTIFAVFGCALVVTSVLFSKQITNVLKGLTKSLKVALDDISQKKNTINTINVELRDRLRQCELLRNQLEASESYIKNIVNSISSGLIAVDKQLNITYYNDHIKTFAHDDTVTMGDSLYSAFPILNQEEVHTAMNDIINTARPFRIRRLHTSYNNASIMLSIAGFPMMNDTQIAGATLLINDITEQEQLRAQMADYEKLSALSQLALGAAHEINNPLQGVTSYIELLLEEEENVEKKTQARQVLDSAYRISETVRGLLNFARPTPPKFTKISLNKLIEETLSFLRHQPLFRKLKIERNLSDAVPQITADANQIRQVLINVLINAAQAMKEGGKLTATTSKVKFEDMVEIKIIDTGTGIPEKDLPKVFNPFFSTKKGEGTGLGLSISYSYVKNHNGKMSISSQLDIGTEVKVILPIRQKGPAQSEVIE